MRSAIVVVLLLGLLPVACKAKDEATSNPQTASARSVTPPSQPPPSQKAGPSELLNAPRGTQLGAFGTTPLPFVALQKIANDATGYANLRIMTEGMITAVCQARGCWMEIADGAAGAHVKMHGHSFSIPRDAAGRRARVEAQVLATPSQGECEREAQQQTGHEVKLQLEATGVELL